MISDKEPRRQITGGACEYLDEIFMDGNRTDHGHPSMDYIPFTL